MAVPGIPLHETPVGTAYRGLVVLGGEKLMATGKWRF
jgi:hypothetical protein